jgi:hypothetical protein
MKLHFGITDEAGKFLCKIYLAMREARLDIVKFDRWLQNTLGHDYNVRDGLSLKQAITKYYSKEAAEFVRKAL